MENELRKKLETTLRVAETLPRVYYNCFDNRRSEIGRLYMENATFSWNGNGSKGRETIQRFILELPNSRHNLTSIDTQPILDGAFGNEATYTLIISGRVKYAGESTKNFQQSFILKTENGEWRILSDCYRIQESC